MIHTCIIMHASPSMLVKAAGQSRQLRLQQTTHSQTTTEDRQPRPAVCRGTSQRRNTRRLRTRRVACRKDAAALCTTRNMHRLRLSAPSFLLPPPCAVRVDDLVCGIVSGYPYPRLNLRCEEHRKGRKAAYTSYFIFSVSDLSF